MNTLTFVDRFKITDGKTFRLTDVDPADHGPTRLKAEAPALMAATLAALEDAQERLYAQDEWAVLLIFQAMDAAGKDGTIKHTMSGVNPAGVQVFSFKRPTPEELDLAFPKVDGARRKELAAARRALEPERSSRSAFR